MMSNGCTNGSSCWLLYTQCNRQVSRDLGPLSERQKERKRLAALSGRMTWRAPLGYLNTGAKSGVNVVVNATVAPYIRTAFELIGSGLHKQSDVLALLTKHGFRTSKGKPILKQQFSAMLCHPVYAGWVTLPSDQTFDPVADYMRRS